MDKENEIKNSRRDALKKIFQGAGLLSAGGIFWNSFLQEAKSSDFVLRPPGAIEENSFQKACIKCGACVLACPYDTLKVSDLKENAFIGTPYFKPREIPCYMCTDAICTQSCPTEALDLKKLIKKDSENIIENIDINKAKMGLAVINKETCIAFWGVQCDACHRACPIIDKAITLEYTKNERTGKHAYAIPVINSDSCTGCGVCEHACITEKSAVRILPRELAEGKVGDHYIKGWDAEDEKRIKEKGKSKEDDSEVPAEDYLNNWEDLLDD